MFGCHRPFMAVVTTLKTIKPLKAIETTLETCFMELNALVVLEFCCSML